MITKRSSHMPALTNIAVTNSQNGLVRRRLNHIICGARPLQTISAMYIFQYGPKTRLWARYSSNVLPLYHA